MKYRPQSSTGSQRHVCTEPTEEVGYRSDTEMTSKLEIIEMTLKY